MKEITYSVRFRRSGLFQRWKMIPNLVGDGVCPDMPHRFFVDKDGVKVEVPVERTVFHFSKERAELIAQREAQRAAEEAEQK